MYREAQAPETDRPLSEGERGMLRRKMRGALVELGVVQLLAPLLLSLPILTFVSLLGIFASLPPGIEAVVLVSAYEAFWIVRCTRRWWGLRRALSGGRAVLGEGIVRWGRFDWIVDVGGRTMRFAEPGPPRLPGRYAVSYLPSARWVLDARALQDSRALYRELLQRALERVFRFSGSDLAHNRQGRLSPAQRIRLSGRAALWTSVAVVVLAVCWSGPVVTRVLGSLVALGAMAFALGPIREAIAPRVVSLEGPVVVRTAPWGRGGSKFYSFEIGGASFTVPHRATIAYDPSASYRVHGCRRIRLIVAMELLA